MAKKNNTVVKVESIRHKDKRANIPTEELRDFMADEELTPNTTLYPRDQSLDPQLVWKGKDEQDRKDRKYNSRDRHIIGGKQTLLRLEIRA